ncbi:MAG: hypothetical protein LAT51_13615 [Flavobacteriaceae bacterium]|nr:hypothetical protein [Flavobacteriaceae bacterium]
MYLTFKINSLIYLCCFCTYAQVSDFNNEEYLFDLEEVNVKDFGYGFSRFKRTLNYGIHLKNVNYKTRGYTIHWNSKNQHLGFINSSITNMPIQIRPLVLGEIKSENQRFFKATYSSMDELVNSLSDEIIAFLLSNLNFKNVERNYQLEKLEIENFRTKIFLHSPLDHLDKVLKIDYDLLLQLINYESIDFDHNLLVPSFLLVTNELETYLHIDLQLFSQNQLIFRTSSNILLKEDLKNVKYNDLLRKSIVESIFHQVNPK